MNPPEFHPNEDVQRFLERMDNLEWPKRLKTAEWLEKCLHTVRKHIGQATNSITALAKVESICLSHIGMKSLPKVTLMQFYHMIHERRKASIVELLRQCPLEMRMEMLTEACAEALNPDG